ncbi:hypothetical protein [Agrobacterium vitis]|nr:hypothetical protein [Agrobacterium vitis]
MSMRRGRAADTGHVSAAISGNLNACKAENRRAGIRLHGGTINPP